MYVNEGERLRKKIHLKVYGTYTTSPWQQDLLGSTIQLTLSAIYLSIHLSGPPSSSIMVTSPDNALRKTAFTFAPDSFFIQALSFKSGYASFIRLVRDLSGPFKDDFFHLDLCEREVEKMRKYYM